MDAKFKVGDHVMKANGYGFPGIVVSVFDTTTGERRYDVECQSPDTAGMIHIYNEGQLRFMTEDECALILKRGAAPSLYAALEEVMSELEIRSTHTDADGTKALACGATGVNMAYAALSLARGERRHDS